MAEARPPATQEVGHIAALAVEVKPATAVTQASLRSQTGTQALPGLLFAKPHLRVAGIG